MATGEAKQGIFQRLDKLYEFDREPVTDDKLQPGSYFAGIFSGEHIAATEFVIGALFVSLGATVYDVLVGLLLGNLLAVLSWTLVCAPIAVKTRLTLYWYLRRIAGPIVTVIYNLLNAMLFCVLAGAMITVSASAIRIPFGIKPQTGWIPDDPWFIPVVLGVGAVVVTLAVLGFKRLAQFAAVCSPWMVVMFPAGALLAIPAMGQIDALDGLLEMAQNKIWAGPAAGQSPLGFWHVAAFAWICNLATHLGLSDMALFRYARRASYGLYSAFGMFLGHYMAWICAGVMGAAAVSMINEERMAGLPGGRSGSPPPAAMAEGAPTGPMAKGAPQGEAKKKPSSVPKGAPKAKAKGGGAPAGPKKSEKGAGGPPSAPKMAGPPQAGPMSGPPGGPMSGPMGGPMGAPPGVKLVELKDVDAGAVAFRCLGVVGAVVVVLAGWTTANPTLYRAGLALQVVTPGWPRWVVTLLAGGITTLVACSPFVFRRLLDFVAIYGILLVPIGAIVVAEHWLFPILGLTQFWSTRKRQMLNWPALAGWLVGLAIAAAAWVSKYVYDYEILHEFFLVIPVWIATTVLYTLLASLAGARGPLPELTEEAVPAAPLPVVRKEVAGGIPLSPVEKGLLYVAGLTAFASLGYWIGSAVYRFLTLKVRSYGDMHIAADELDFHHLVFLISAVIWFHLWEKSLPWNRTLYLASGLTALACLGLCVLFPVCGLLSWLMPDIIHSHLITVTLTYFVAAIVWMRQREKRKAATIA